MLSYLTAGESHGPQLTAIIEGLPAGLRIDADAVDFQLQRRQKGYGRGGRMKIERDRIQLVGGVRHGLTLGGPVSLVIENRDWPNWTGIMHPTEPLAADLNDRQRKLAEQTSKPRPGHADLAGGIKYNHHDLRNVLERASARETAARVAVGSIARQLLEVFGIQFASHVVRIGTAALSSRLKLPDSNEIRQTTEESPVRCVHEATEKKMIEAIKRAGSEKDSLGGIAEVIVEGLPAGLGTYSQGFRRLDGRLAGALMGVPSVKAVEVGLGLEYAKRRGSKVHDQIYRDPDKAPTAKGFYRRSNNAGGIEGGVTNGEPVVVRVTGKPISTLNQPLATVDVLTGMATTAMVERTDICVIPALAVVCEAVVAIVLAEAFLEKFGADNMSEIKRNYQSWLQSEY